MRCLLSISPYLLLLFPITNAQFPTLSLPVPSGPHKIGTTTLYLPNPKTSPPRDIMISLFYPTLPSINSTTYPILPVYDPYYSAFVESSIGLPPGLVSLLQSRAHTSAPLLTQARKTHHRRIDRNRNCNNPPILLFSPGYGGSRLEYTATMSNLASEGFIVIGVDHPFDTAFITYPNGRTAFYQPEQLNETRAAQVVDLRVKDLRFVLDSLASDEQLAKAGLPGLKGRLDVGDVGVFGHSIGGAASASAILADKRFDCGSNLDGSFWGPVAQKGIKNPFMIMSAETRNSTNDPSWASFWKNSKSSFELEISVKGSAHGSYSDPVYLFGILVQLGLFPAVPAEAYGTIDGARMLGIESAYLTSFFDYCFTGKKDKLLKGPSTSFPEVVFFPK